MDPESDEINKILTYITKNLSNLDQNKWVNIDTCRLNSNSTYLTKKAQFSDTYNKFFSVQNQELFSVVCNRLNSNPEIPLIKTSRNRPRSNIREKIREKKQEKKQVKKQVKKVKNKKEKVEEVRLNFDNDRPGPPLELNQTRGLSVRLRNLVWRERFETFIGQCYCCTLELDYQKWHCGHIKAYADGGSNSVENLRPTCEECNLKMGTMDMILFICIYGLQGLDNINLDIRSNNKTFKKSVIKTITFAEKIRTTCANIDELVKHKLMKKGDANIYRKQLLGKRVSTLDRKKSLKEIMKIVSTFNT